jgi:hypothetical protein
MSILILKHRIRPVVIERLSFSAVLTPEVDKVALQHSGLSMGYPTTTKKEDFDQMMFSLFGGGEPETFFPTITNSDIIPKAEDFVDIPFRFITETIVGGGSWKASNFKKNKVLQPSTQLLANKPMFTEHDQTVSNWVGLSVDPYWDAETEQEGLIVPPGISGTARVDFKTNPKLSRGLIFGAVGSVSVTIDFAWEPSHTFKEMGEFYEKIGSYGSDKEMVSRVAVDVRDYHESSFVWLGADPFAKRKTQHGLTNIDKNSIYFSKPETLSYDKVDGSVKEKYDTEKSFAVECGIPETIISLSQERSKKPTSTNPQNTIPMNKFLLAFLSAYGTKVNLSFTAADIKDGKLSDAQELELTNALSKLGMPASVEETAKLATFTKLEAMALTAAKEKDPNATTVDMGSFVGSHTFVDVTKLAELRIADTTITEMATELKVEAKDVATTVKGLNARAIVGDEYAKFKRDEAVRLYKLAKGDKADEKMIELINKSTGTELDALLKSNGGDVNMQYGAHCTKCNSSEGIEMRSSIPSEEDDSKETSTSKSAFTVEDMREKYGEQEMYIGGGKKDFNQ